MRKTKEQRRYLRRRRRKRLERRRALKGDDRFRKSGKH